MKIKPLYIYLSVIGAIIIFFAIYSLNSGNETKNVSGEMPQDEVHQGMNSPHGGGTPGEGNVLSSAKEKMMQLEKEYNENPNDTAIAKQYADFIKMAHKQEKAIEIYEDILDKDSKRTDVRFSLAQLYFTLNDMGKAESMIRGILKYDSKNAQALYNLGVVESTKGNTEEAKKIWTELLKQDPPHPLDQMTETALKNTK